MVLKRLRHSFSLYVTNRKNSSIAFWHTPLGLNSDAFIGPLDRYYMDFRAKSGYKGPFDEAGIPMLDYGSQVGVQYNPCAAAQWALGQYDLVRDGAAGDHATRFLAVADWFVKTLARTEAGSYLWMYNFDWPFYDPPMLAPWPSALAQGQAISVLVRAYLLTGQNVYMDTAAKALRALHEPIADGGLVHEEGADFWLEEQPIYPVSHILNGHIWASWGLLDYARATGDPQALSDFERAAATARRHLGQFDNGYWSCYHMSKDRGTQMPASFYYHHLHVLELQAMGRLAPHPAWEHWAERWGRLGANPMNQARALVAKVWFKLTRF